MLPHQLLTRALLVGTWPHFIWENWGWERECNLAKDTAAEVGVRTWAWRQCSPIKVRGLMWYSGSRTTNEPRWITKLRICPARPYWPKGRPWESGSEKRQAVVRNISYSLEYLELGQAGHWQVNYLYLAGDGNGNGDRLSFWAPPWGAILALGSPGVEAGELEESR